MNNMSPEEALRMARELQDYLTKLYDDEPSDDSVADRHLQTATMRSCDLVRALDRWNKRMKEAKS